MQSVIAQYGTQAYVGCFDTTSSEMYERDAVISCAITSRHRVGHRVRNLSTQYNAIDPLAGGTLLRRADVDDLQKQRIHDDRC